MLKSFFAVAFFCTTFALPCFAQTPQSTPAQTTRTRTTTTTNAPATTAPQTTRAVAASPQTTTAPATATQTSRARTAEASRPAATTTPAASNRSISRAEPTGVRDEPGMREVLIAFDALVQGIGRADVNAVTNAYWNSPQLVLFNNNGTVTKTWEQLRKNRASSYPEMKDVRLNIRDRQVQMLAPTAALVTCLWTQSQTFRGTPETASGRMTLVYRRIGGSWKIVHLHTSPDAPDPSRVPASERDAVTAPATGTNASPQPAPVRVRPKP